MVNRSFRRDFEMKDWRGTPIVPGSIVVYPGRHGSSHWMMEAEVIAIEEYRAWEWEDLKWTLKVLPLRQGTYGRTNMKPVRLTALERVTVVDSPNKESAKVGWPDDAVSERH